MSTSEKLKKESKKIDRPFEPMILKRAKEFAKDYQIVVWLEDGKFYGRGLELPLVMSGGKTADECIRNMRDALETAVAFMLEEGERPPTPATSEARSVQLNVRLTTSEKLLLEQAAQRSGFRGISDYVRHAALTHGDN